MGSPLDSIDFERTLRDIILLNIFKVECSITSTRQKCLEIEGLNFSDISQCGGSE